jgi:cell wall-associated NlpC family hydrolase
MARIRDLPVDYTLKRSTIIEVARAWVGAPYRHQGRGRAGIDCVGLLVEVAKGVGHPVVAPTAYSSMPQGHQLLNPCDAQLWKPRRQTTIKPGDLMVFCGISPLEPQHFAFASTHGSQMTIIHSFSKYGAVVEQEINRLWRTKFHCLYVLPGTEDPE